MKLVPPSLFLFIYIFKFYLLFYLDLFPFKSFSIAPLFGSVPSFLLSG